MNKKRIRQMNTQLLRRLQRRPAGDWFARRKDFLQALERENYMQRFAPLLDGGRVQCAQALELCRDTLGQLCPQEPQEGWLACAFSFARRQLFPEQEQEASCGAGAAFLLSVLQVLFAAEREMLPFDPLWDFAFLSEEEQADSPCAAGYGQMLRLWKREYVYEMMRLGLEVTPFRALEHIAGVHHIAVTMGRGLKESGVPVDLALVSGAAAGHDIGKFGCRPGERVPYLHYYYTDLWFRRRKLTDIGHVAANHSVWDLEPDYLSVEALLLIYADFRVKQTHGAHGEEITHISTLSEAFDVILAKLDGVDEQKKERYRRVYTRLRDFERFLIAHGVDTTLQGRNTPPRREKPAALMTDGEALEVLRLVCVEHNVRLMDRLTGLRSFAQLLEQARGETDWRRLRTYLGVIESYSLYLRLPQKMETLAFLYELLMHREGDIRRQAAALMGAIIADFHAGYVKERPAGSRPLGNITDIGQWKLYLEQIIFPDHKLMPQHRSWIGYTLKFVVNSLLQHCHGREERFLDCLLAYCRAGGRVEAGVAFQLLDTFAALPLERCTPAQRETLLRFAESSVRYRELTVRTAAALLLRELLAVMPDQPRVRTALKKLPCGDSTSLTLLRDRLLAGEAVRLPDETISEIFLDNLKTATHWSIRRVNILLLAEHAKAGGAQVLHIAAHFSNLIKVSDRVTVRHSAGGALLELAPLLSVDQRNEIAVELCRGLELGQQEFTKYIPEYLGRFALWLPPEQLDELLAGLSASLSSSEGHIVASALDTAAEILERYSAYGQRFAEPEELRRGRARRLLGMLMKGTVGIDAGTQQEAMYLLGRHVFGSAVLEREEKCRALQLTVRRILALCQEESEGGLYFYYRAAMLGKLYRLMVEQELSCGGVPFDPPRPVAFFPGTFDPFTLSHKGIVRAIRDAGFEVLLAIDEFSWSKRTQPYRIRREIAAMSVADEFYVHIFPEDFPVNIANPENLRRLRQAFPDRQVSIVVGSDVVAHASSYHKPAEPDSIHSFDHVIFRRAGADAEADYGCLSGHVLELTLPEELEEISSTRIREAVDANRDISHLIDPMAQEFIYRHSLYLREPLDKPVLRTEDLEFLPCGAEEERLRALVQRSMPASAAETVLRSLRLSGDDVLLLCHGESKTVLGAAVYRCMDSRHLFSRLSSAELAAFVRENAGGRTLLVSGLLVPPTPQQSELGQLLLTEVLTLALGREYTYALYMPLEGFSDAWVRELLPLQGFVSVPKGCSRSALAVDMRQPIILSNNVDTTIKPPLSTAPPVVAAVAEAHRRLQETMTKLQPGSLVLSLSAGVIYHRLLRRITACNGVPEEPTQPRKLGPDICVPYGKLLRGVIVPNTVTKTLRTDKVYEPDLSSYSIEAYPDYSPLEDQVRTIRAFDRPAILVDDVLHDGKRIRRLAPLLQKTGTQVKKVLVGYLTGTGRDLMESLGYDAEGVYYLPNLRMRFVESTLYPFIGGDTIRRSERLEGGLQPSVNRILPYASPEFSPLDPETAWDLSLCCLENARNILLALETEYRRIFARNLTLARLSEAVILPLCPDKGGSMTYDLSRGASTYLDDDIELLKRMRFAPKEAKE